MEKNVSRRDSQQNVEDKDQIMIDQIKTDSKEYEAALEMKVRQATAMRD